VRAMMRRSLPSLSLCLALICLAAGRLPAEQASASPVGVPAEAAPAQAPDSQTPAVEAEPATTSAEAAPEDGEPAESPQAAPAEGAPSSPAESAGPAAEAPPAAVPPAEAPPAAVPPAAVPEAGPAQPEEAVPPPPPPAPIVSIEVVGNKEIPLDEITAVITSQVGGRYSEETATRDRQAVLNLGWFQTVALERESVENGVRLVFRVVENPVIQDIQFEGAGKLTPDQLLSVMQTKPGTVYNTYRLARDAQAVEDLYQKNGYSLALVIGQRIDEQHILTLVIAEGVIESVEVRGNTYTKPRVIRRYVRTRPGDTYNDKQVSQDVARIANTGFFETVRRDAEVGREPGKVILVITVVEKQRTGEATVGGAYTSDQGMIGFVGLTKTNLRGSGQTISLRSEFGGRRTYELGYRNPWIMTPETRLSLGLYDRSIFREAFVTTPGGARQSILYDEKRTGGSVSLGRPVSDYTTYYVSLRRDDVSISGLSEEEKPYLAGAAFLPREVRSITLASVTDTRDNLYNPHRGAFHQLSFEFAGVFGGSSFNKYTLDTRRYFRMGGRSVLAMRLLAGTVTGDAPYLEQFLVGGPDSLRGYRTDRFAGSRMAIVNTEYRFPLSSNLVGVGFVDVGSAWGGAIAADPFFLGEQSLTAHVGYGVGVRVNTPIGPLRLDLGFSGEGTETHFGVYQMF